MNHMRNSMGSAPRFADHELWEIKFSECENRVAKAKACCCLSVQVKNRDEAVRP